MRDIALQRIGKAIASRRPNQPHGAQEWLLRFGPGPAAADDPRAHAHRARVVHVRIDGVAPKDLRSVHVAQLDGPANLQVDSVPDGRCGQVAAGELVLAMATQFGLAGMTVDVSLMQLEATLTSVNIAVAAPSAEAAERAAVFVVEEPAP